MRRVVRQRADRGRPRRRRRRLARRERRRVQPGEQARRRRFDVALDAGHLAGEEQRRPRAHLPRLGEHGRAVHVGVAVHHAEADELGLLEPGNQPQHARLLAPFDLRLEADEAEVIAGEVVLPQLHGGVRLAAGARIDQADRLHRSEAQRVARRDAPSPRSAGSLRRTAPCRSRGRSPTPRVTQRVVEALVLVARQRAVQIVALPIVHAARSGRTGRHRCARRVARRGAASTSETPIPPRRAEDLRRDRSSRPARSG